MHQIKLSKEEKEILRKYNKTSPIGLIRLKSQAILMRDEELKELQIAKIIGRSERTIRRWISNFVEIRIGSIFSGKRNNENASKLSRKQKKEVKRILQKKPSEYSIPKEFWDVPALKSYVKAEFGMVYESKQSYHFLLKFSELSFKNPALFDIRRNERLIVNRMKEIVKELRPLLDDNNWEVFVSDETRIMYEAITRRAWLKRGKKTVIKVERNREAQSYIGLLSQKDFRCSVYRLQWQNQKEILKALKKFLRKFPKKKICIIWDNARFHKGKLIQEALRRGNLLERVHLINLPPYAPDMNPIEHLWGTVKAKIANIQFKSFQDTKLKFESYIRGKIFKYEIGHFVLS